MMVSSALVPLVLYAILLTVAASEDVLRLRISNLTNVFILILGVVTLALNGDSDWWQHILAFVLALGFGVGLYAINWLGGGDAKFIAATGFAFSLKGLAFFLLSTSLAGAVLAILYLGSRLFRGRQADNDGRKLPYGVAIACGAALTWLLAPETTLVGS